MKKLTPFREKTFKAWEEKARSEFRGSDLSDLDWNTPEGIEFKPLYTASDLEELEWTDSFPGIFPFVRGPRATMYAGRP